MSEQRKHDLENLLSKANESLTKLDQRILVETHPLERGKLEIDRDNLKQQIADLKKELITLEKSPATSNPPGDNLQAIAQAYLNQMQDEFKRLKYKSDPISLRNRPGQQQPQFIPPDLEDLWMEMSEIIEPRYKPAPSGNLAPDPKQEIVPVEDFLAQHQRIALLGEPGAGKSTTLRRLFRNYKSEIESIKSEELKLSDVPPIPLFISLNSWQNNIGGLVEFLQSQIEQYSPELAQRLPELLQGGKVVLLLDGLNELPGLQRDKEGQIDDKRAKEIAEIGQKWAGVKCVLSCRVRDFEGGPLWRDLHVRPLEESDILAFATAYYQGHPEAAAIAQNLVQQLFELPDSRAKKLQDHARNPFYLTFLVKYFYQAQQNLPENPAKLLEFSVTKAIERELIQKQGLTPEAAQPLAAELKTRLSYLAFNLTDAQKVAVDDPTLAATWLYHIRDKQKVGLNMETWKLIEIDRYEPEASPEQITEAANLLKLAEDASLISVTGNQIRFFHQLLQEYFAGLYCSRQELTSFLFIRTIPYWFAEIWPLWAGIDNDLVKQLMNWLQHHTEPVVRQCSATALGRIGDRQAVRPLIAVLEDTNSFVQSSAIGALGLIGDR